MFCPASPERAACQATTISPEESMATEGSDCPSSPGLLTRNGDPTGSPAASSRWASTAVSWLAESLASQTTTELPEGSTATAGEESAVPVLNVQLAGHGDEGEQRAILHALADQVGAKRESPPGSSPTTARESQTPGSRSIMRGESSILRRCSSDVVSPSRVPREARPLGNGNDSTPCRSTSWAVSTH